MSDKDDRYSGCTREIEENTPRVFLFQSIWAIWVEMLKKKRGKVGLRTANKTKQNKNVFNQFPIDGSEVFRSDRRGNNRTSKSCKVLQRKTNKAPQITPVISLWLIYIERLKMLIFKIQNHWPGENLQQLFGHWICPLKITLMQPALIQPVRRKQLAAALVSRSSQLNRRLLFFDGRRLWWAKSCCFSAAENEVNQCVWRPLLSFFLERQ